VPITPAEVYAALLARAEQDPNVLAFWLGGSRGMGRPTEHSDYDCALIVADQAIDALRTEFGIEGVAQMDWRPGVDLLLMTMGQLEHAAAWGSDQMGHRYAFAHLRAMIDKTGEAQPLIDAKARVPHEAVAGFIEGSLDYLINQLYRALKCLRDGDAPASRLEAAEAVKPYLDAVFALHGGRLRPYYKYLAWELETYPLDQLAFAPQELLDRLAAVLGEQAGLALRDLVAATLPAFRSAGFTASVAGWGEAMDWMLAWRSV
jgi:hypothetical protein